MQELQMNLHNQSERIRAHPRKASNSVGACAPAELKKGQVKRNSKLEF